MSADRKDILLNAVSQQRDQALNQLANMAADAQVALNERDEQIVKLTKLNAEQALKIAELEAPTSGSGEKVTPIKKGLKPADAGL